VKEILEAGSRPFIEREVTSALRDHRALVYGWRLAWAACLQHRYHLSGATLGRMSDAV